MPREGRELRQAMAALALAIVTIVVFAPLRDAPFIAYDDPLYVTANPHVVTGLTPDNVAFAFTSTTYAANWHPLAWLSHMLDAQLFGPQNARGPHLVNVLLHAASAAVLLLALARMTGDDWCSIIAAAAFALHPLRVESVAWVSERKDLLCGLFFLLSIAAYAWYVRLASVRRYAVVIVLALLALLSKPMAVTLPFVLLLLDYWPLGRWRYEGTKSLRWLALEKLPLLAMSIAVAAITMIAQRAGGAVQSVEAFPLTTRLQVAVLACGRYLLQAIWPRDLSIFYPYPAHVPQASWLVALLLLAITAASVAMARRWPFLVVGWLWFIGMLVPVIGLVQVGLQSGADRYTYLPSIGLSIAIAWGAATIVGKSRARARLASGVAIALVLALAVLTRIQIRYWTGGTLSLFQHALNATDLQTNWLAHGYVGSALADGRRYAEAEQHLLAARSINPNYAEVHFNLGNLYRRQRRFDEAIASYRRALALRPGFARAWNNLGVTLADTGDRAGAIECFQRALSADPSYDEARQNLALTRATTQPA